MNTKTIFAVLASQLIFVSCQEPIPPAQACSLNIDQDMAEYAALMEDNNPNNDPEQPPRECVIPEKEPGADMRYHVELTDFNPEKEAKMLDALERAKIVINSAEFKRRVLEHTYNGQKTFVNNNGQSNEEIYETIMAAKEDLLPQVDQEMDLDITLYYKNNSTVGYTYPNTIRIWVNDKFFSGYTLGEVAANAVHEWTHKIGYGHSYYNSPERPYSVPYGIGTIIKEMVDGM